MASLSPATDAPQPIVFRGKKRKTYRQRPNAEAETEEEASVASIQPVHDAPGATTIQASSASPISTSTNEEENEAIPISEALRLRNSRKSKLRGVTFGADSNAQTGDSEGGDDELSEMIREEEKKAMEKSITTANKRFAPQTGLSGEVVNKHM